MDLISNWNEVKSLFKDSFKSSFHFSIASVTEKGEPHVTPVGSLILGKPGQGIYFDKFPQQLPFNLKNNNKVCIMAVNSGRWFWFNSLFKGKFSTPPAVRLYGEVGALREATETEIALWEKRVKSVSFTKGHALIWKGMSQVRDIKFDRIEAVNIGEMTRSNWKDQ